MPAVKQETLRIAEGTSFRDILLLINGVQEMRRDGKIYISLKHGLNSIKDAVRGKKIPYGKLYVVIAALYRALQTDVFYESPEEVGELTRGFNEFIEGVRVGARLGADTVGEIARFALGNK